MTTAEQVKARLDVVTLIQSYLKLDKAGINFKAPCPFHSERTPSFFVSPARDSWHCFGCGKGGDIFAFVMEIDGVEFPQALRMLADRAGIELHPQDREERSEKAKLYKLLEDATCFFESNLESFSAGLEYLQGRGVIPETIKEFRLGFAPDSWRALGDYLKRKGYTEAEIEKCGLSVRGSRGPYDRFRSRIIFPLVDTLGRPVGFAGRILGVSSDEDPVGAKYINSPQTALYDKSRFLYGFDKAKNDIRQQKTAVLVEGNIDLILSHQAGVKNTVAVSGTALTESHLTMLRRLADSLVFALDVDKAGIAASRRALELSYAQDFNVRVADIEGGKDPADIVAKDPTMWRTIIENALDSIAFFLKKSIGDSQPSDPLTKKKIAGDILPLVARIANEIEKAHWVRELARILKIGEEAIWRELNKYSKNTEAVLSIPEVPQENVPHELTRKARLEERIIGFLLLEPGLAALGDLPLRSECSLAITGDLLERLTSHISQGTIGEILKELPEDARRSADRYLFEAELFAESVVTREEEYLNTIRSWKELSIKEKLSNLRLEIEQLEKSGSREETRVRMDEFQKLTAHLSGIMTLHNYYNDKKEKKEKR
jgi:DNA primase